MPNVKPLIDRKEPDESEGMREAVEHKISFHTTLPKALYVAERGYRAMRELGEMAKKQGVSEMSLDEINAEIEASRRERHAKSSMK